MRLRRRHGRQEKGQRKSSSCGSTFLSCLQLKLFYPLLSSSSLFFLFLFTFSGHNYQNFADDAAIGCWKQETGPVCVLCVCLPACVSVCLSLSLSGDFLFLHNTRKQATQTRMLLPYPTRSTRQSRTCPEAPPYARLWKKRFHTRTAANSKNAAAEGGIV